jgi:hypothetical protein
MIVLPGLTQKEPAAMLAPLLINKHINYQIKEGFNTLTVSNPPRKLQ